MSDTKIDDGGPAFPGSWHPEMGWSPRDTPEGMSLRDWFAGMALSGILNRKCSVDDAKWTADDAYKYADAMLSARKRVTR